MKPDITTRDQLISRAARAARDYLSGVDDRAVFPSENAIAGLDALGPDISEHGRDDEQVLDLLIERGGPATVAQGGGRYFGFVNGGVLPVALAARIVADAWDQNAAMGVMSPVAAKTEALAQDWLVDLLGLPKGCVAGFVSGTSTATLAGLLAARGALLARLGWDVNARGLFGAPPLRVVTGAQCHGTVLKAIAMAGIGTDGVTFAPVDDNGAIRAETLPPLDANTIVISQAGHVVTGAFDPVGAICRAAKTAGSWVHVDGAFGLWAAASRRFAHLTDGLELADSWSADAHKTLNLPYDSGIVFCRDPQALTGALHNSGSYIVLGTGARDGMLTTPEMSRRARGIEIWAALAHLGRSGVAALVDQLHDRACQFAQGLEAAGFTVLNRVNFNQVAVACDTDQATNATLSRLQQSGEAWASGAVWAGREVIRISVCSWATTPDDVERTIATMITARSPRG